MHNPECLEKMRKKQTGKKQSEETISKELVKQKVESKATMRDKREVKQKKE